jgi:hypothetical protein
MASDEDDYFALLQTMRPGKIMDMWVTIQRLDTAFPCGCAERVRSVTISTRKTRNIAQLPSGLFAASKACFFPVTHRRFC